MVHSIYTKRELILDQRSFQAVTHGLIPVPSRLGFEQPNPATPLAGKRIAVKDIFDLKGVKTTLCSKAYEELTTEARTTATCIQRLIDLGAVIVGKVKTSPFASGMGPRDWVDVQPPFNPRGDGYLDPGCSSAGSGAAIAGYDWLDVAIGSDSELLLQADAAFDRC
jgi:Asp-tRNA(Asn)/Glu-tRNA(Gln) amidotransferase A subunit family amidase